MKIAITGATGQLGRLIVKKLQERSAHAELVGLVRSPASAQGLGLPLREADYSKRETLLDALRGIDTLMLVSSSEVGQRSIQHQNVIDAARRCGVGRIVYTSVLRASLSNLSVAGEHFDTEVRLEHSEIPSTILRNGWYTENYAGLAPGAVKRGALIGCAGGGRISAAAREDYAEAAAVVLTSEGHEGRTYELAGDSSFTLTDLAREISFRIGKEIPYKDLPRAQYESLLKVMGLPAELAKEYAGFDASASSGALFDGDRQLSSLINRPTTPLALVVAKVLDGAVAPASDKSVASIKEVLQVS